MAPSSILSALCYTATKSQHTLKTILATSVFGCHWRACVLSYWLNIQGHNGFGPKKGSTIIIWNTGSWETNAASDPVCFEHTKIGLAITCGTNVIKLYNRVSRQTRVINKGQQRYTYLIHFFNLCTTLHQPKRKENSGLRFGIQPWTPQFGRSIPPFLAFLGLLAPRQLPSDSSLASSPLAKVWQGWPRLSQGLRAGYCMLDLREL